MEEMTDWTHILFKVVLWEKERGTKKGIVGGQGRPNEKGSFHNVVKDTTQEAAEELSSMSSKSFKEQKHDGILK